ncbi:MAG: hypothetical protein AMS23_06135 [Bacteroides sp. SM1_62]|nr:MAG: hypothetical protein AMS23_06135 [Bacteroides sp. SM1_62]
MIFAQDEETENYNVFDSWIEWSNGSGMLTKYLNEQAFYYLDQRDKTVEMFESRGDWKTRQAKVRESLLLHMGPFPEKTPLNPKITGILQKGGFRIEKIVFESLSNYYVTGCLFIPDGITGKQPAILYVSGHADLAYKDPAYQKVIFNLVKKGFIVFAIDPIGQGERLQYYDPVKGESIIGGPTREHTHAGNQCFLLGTSINKYFIWDGIRAIDYLQIREEVDPDRIGITGRSGGGTQSAFIAAFDERIVASAPENYITSHRRLLESRGPQDAEQNFYHWISDGGAIEDLLVVRIPKPTLLVTTTRDIFSIQGTREVYEQVLNGYIAFGKEEDFLMVEDHAAHGSTKRNREAVYKFFQKYLSLPGDGSDEDVEILTPEELYVTNTGQLATSLGGETVFSLNRKEAEQFYEGIMESRQHMDSHLELTKEHSKRLSGYHIPRHNAGVVYRGSYQKKGYTIGMYALEADDGYIIPLLLVTPEGQGPFPVVIYIHPDGKEQGMASGGIIEILVNQGYMVASPDLLGIGETNPDARFPAAPAFEALLIGRSLVGIQAGDVSRVVEFLARLPNVNKSSIQAVAVGELCPALMHAGVFEPGISGVALIEAPVSYYNITQTRLYELSLSFSWGVAGALTAYDLPDLAACIAPRKLALIGLQNARIEPATEKLIDNQMRFPRKVYENSKPGNLTIISKPSEELIIILSDWLEQ